MTIHMDHVGVIVDDLPAAIAFFIELGLEKEGEASLEGEWVDQIVGLDDVQADIAVMRTPDGHCRLELTKYNSPPTVRGAEQNRPANAAGIGRLTFTIDDIDATLARLRSHGGELVGEVVQYQDIIRYCYVRGPEGIIIGLAQQLG